MSDQLPAWINGAQLLSWLEHDRRAIDTTDIKWLDDRFERMVRRWKEEGTRSRVHDVDEFLCSIDVCLGEVPEEFYCEDPRAKKGPWKPVTPEKSERIAKLRELGWTVREIAAMVGVTRRTVERHARKAAA